MVKILLRVSASPGTLTPNKQTSGSRGLTPPYWMQAPAEVQRSRDSGKISVVSKPWSNHLMIYLVVKGGLRRVAYKDRRRAILKAVTSPEDRLGEELCLQHGTRVVNSKLKTSVKTNAATTGNVWRLGACSIILI